MQMHISPKSGVNTLRDTRSAVGLLRDSSRYGPAQLMKMAIGKISARSMNRNWKSPRFDAEAYKKLTEVNCIAEYRLMYLKQLKLVTSAALPSLQQTD